MMRNRRLGPTLGAILCTLTLSVLLTSCQSDEAKPDTPAGAVAPSESDSVSESASPSEGKTVGAAGISFQVPDGWTTLDSSEVAEGQSGNPVLAELGDRMGMTPAQVEQMLGQIDLFVFSGDGANGGFLDNINVIAQPAAKLPTDGQLKLQMLQLGADVVAIDRRTTGLGETAVVDYTLNLGQPEDVAARVVVAPTSDGIATITISSNDRAVVDQLGETVLQTLSAA